MSIVLGEEPTKKIRYVFQFHLPKEKFSFDSHESELPSVIISENFIPPKWQPITLKMYLFKSEDQPLLKKLMELLKNQSENDVSMAKLFPNGKIGEAWNLFNVKVIKVFVEPTKEDYQETEITIDFDYAVKIVLKEGE